MSAPVRAHRGADVVMLGLAVLWGGTFVVVKDALVDASPVVFLALRFPVGVLALFLWLRRWPKGVLVWKRGTVLGLLLAAGYLLQTWGIELTTPARVGFLTGLSVLMVPFVAWAIERRAPSGWPVLGAVVASFGLYVFTGSGTVSFGPGEWLTLGCAVAYAVHIALTTSWSQGVDAGELVLVQLAVTAVVCAATLPFSEVRLDPTPRLWVAVVVCGVLANALAIGAQTWAQARTTAARAALFYALEPVWAALFSVLLGRETLGRAEIGGGALIVFGVLVAELGAAWRARRPQPA